MRVLDLTGRVFTKLTALNVVGKNKYNVNLWNCQCSCGNTKVVPTNYLTNGDTKSCGCYQATKGRRMDLVGQKYNKLTVVSYSHKTENNSMAFYNCACDCGNTTTVAHGALRSGKTKSCGCIRLVGEDNHNYIHGKSKTKVHSTWLRIRERCYNKNSQDYQDYGAKGITVDPLFLNDFEAFYTEVGEPPAGRYSLDRINHKVGYFEGNLRWATDSQQAQNKGKQRNNTSGVSCVHFYHSGKPAHSTYTIATWADLDGRTRNKKFNCNKLGLLPAFKAAFEYRRNKIIELNNNGAEYSLNHGQ